MTWDTIIKYSPVCFTVREQMKQVASANTLTEAHDRAYWIQRALMEDFNQEISDTLNKILKEYHNEPEFAIIERGSVNGITPPPFLSNTIFVTELKVPLLEESFVYIDINSLWFWIYRNFVPKLSARYEWLALFLFARWKGLIPKEITTDKFCRQMCTWFGSEYTKIQCSYTQVTCYQAGFFRSDDYDYRKWTNEKINIIPSSYKLRKGQNEEGFKRIQELCISLESNYSLDSIQVMDRNR